MIGVSGILVVQPFDMIKTRMQLLQRESTTTTTTTATKNNRSNINLAKEIYKKEGFLSFYKGSQILYLLMVANTSFRFVGYEYLKDYVANLEMFPKTLSYFFSGAIVSAVSFLPIALSEHAKIPISAQNQIYNGSIDAAIQIYKKYGIKSLCRGGTVTFLRQFIGGGTFFMSWDIFLEKVDGNKKNASAIDIMLGGAGAGVISWISVYPFDVLKTHMQSDSLDKPLYKGYIDAIKKIQSTEPGYSKWFRGINSCIFRTIPATGIALLTYVTSLKYLEQFFTNFKLTSLQ